MNTKEVVAILKTLHVGESEKPVYEVVIDSLEKGDKLETQIILVAGSLFVGFLLFVALVR